MLDTKRYLFKGLEQAIGRSFGELPLPPNHYTYLAVIFAGCALAFLAGQNLRAGLLFFAVSAGLDFVDGAVARHKKSVSKSGAYLDTIADRYVEGFIFLGMLFLPLPTVLFPAGIWIFLAFFGSFMTTYAKAAAMEKGLVDAELKGGLLSRGERIILIFLVLILGIFYPDYAYMTYVLILIAILSNMTALQRIVSAMKQGK